MESHRRDSKIDHQMERKGTANLKLYHWVEIKGIAFLIKNVMVS